MSTTSAREILRQADEIRSLARQAEKAASLLRPGTRLGLEIGSYRVDEPKVVAVIERALSQAAVEWNVSADLREATVSVTPALHEFTGSDRADEVGA